MLTMPFISISFSAKLKNKTQGFDKTKNSTENRLVSIATRSFARATTIFSSCRSEKLAFTS